jgi:hypothetical protein
MRIQTVALLLTLSVVLAGPACKRRNRAQIQQTEEEAPQLASTVHVADPRAAAQLISGFYDIEQNAWRWTAGKFAVMLRVPRGAAQKGAVLHLKFSLPEAVVARLKSVSVGAMIEGTALKPQAYAQAGEFTYDPDVPAALLARDAVKVDFVLDKSLAAGTVEQRELGLIVTSVGFETK